MKFRISFILIISIFSINTTQAEIAQAKSVSRIEQRSNPDPAHPIQNHSSFRRNGAGGQKFAIIIGQDEYQQNPLKTCVNDARKMDYLVKNKLNYQNTHVKLFLDKQISYAILRKLITNLAMITTKEDFVFFYYSGHGVKVMDRVKQKQTSALLLSTFENVKARIFARWISRIKAQSLFVFDSCYSGGMFSSEFIGALNGEMKSTANDNYFFLSSSGSNEISMTMPSAGLSRFTYFFQKALLENLGDTNHDGKLSLLEVFNWSRQQTISYGDKFGHRHNPAIFGSNAHNVILKKYIRQSGERPSRLPEGAKGEPAVTGQQKIMTAI